MIEVEQPPKVGIFMNGKDRIGRFFRTSLNCIYFLGGLLLGVLNADK